MAYESAYLNPPPLTLEEAKGIYGSKPEEEKLESLLVKAAQASRRRRLRKSRDDCTRQHRHATEQSCNEDAFDHIRPFFC